MAQQERPPKEGTNLADGIHIYYDTPEMQATRTRLRDGGDYQTEDQMTWFDEEGRPRYLKVESVDPASSELSVQITHPRYSAAVFDRNVPDAMPDHEQMAFRETDKFCRGVRADLSILLNELNWTTTQLTVQFPIEAYKEAQRTGDWSNVPKTDDQILREGLHNGIKEFYYQTPPNYQALFDAISAIVAFTNQRVSERSGLAFTDIESFDDVTKLLNQTFGISGITQVGQLKNLGPGVMGKYASRLDACGRAALALFQVWMQENPERWESKVAIDE